jgi:hypothetical protein
MKPLLAASLLSTAIAASGCGMMSPAKDPDSLTVQVPLEQASPAPQKRPAAQAAPSISDQLIASVRKDMSAVCSDLESGNSQCTGEVFQNITDDEADNRQISVLRNRCLALMAECEKNAATDSSER